MKIISTAILTSALMFLNFSTASAQNSSSGGGGGSFAIPPELPMIKSATLLRAFAFHRAVRATMDVGSPGQVPNRGVRVEVLKQGNETADDLVNTLAGRTVQFTLASPRDKVNLYVQIMDEYGFPLFYGSQNFTMTFGNNGEPRLPQNWEVGFIKLNKRIRIPFPGVRNVEIVFRNAKGDIDTNPSLTLLGDGFLLPFEYVDRRGEIKVSYVNSMTGFNGTAVYDLENGRLRPAASLVNVSQNFPGLIEHYSRYSDATEVSGSGWHKETVLRFDVTKGLYTDFLIFLEGGQPARAVIIAFTLPSELPSENSGELHFIRTPLVEGRARSVSFPQGKYFLFFESEVDQFREIHYDNEGGGKD